MRRFAILAAVMLMAASFSPSLLAQGKGKGKQNAASVYSIALEVVNDNGNSLPDYGESVRVNVSTTATNVFVSLSCYQGTTLVYAGGGLPVSFAFMLSSAAWTGGEAECTASVFTTIDGSKTTNLGSLSFHVGA
jgi:hypothetical protein